MIVNKNSD